MPDREKVIKALEICYCPPSKCEDCPYHDLPVEQSCNDVLCLDALTLLKEHEAVEPKFKQDNNGIFVWACGSCGAYMYHIYDGIDKAKEYAKYCRQCGRKVKWE